MVAEAKELTEQEQAAFFHARERRRSLAGIVQLYRTSRIFGPAMAADIPDVLLSGVLASPITFQTAVRINSGTDAGLIFGYGSGTSAVGLWLNSDQTLGFHAGAAGVDGATALTPALAVGGEFDIVVSVRPGNDKVRIWVNGREAARADSVNGIGTFAAAGADGDFAQAGGPFVADITEQGAPTGFEVIEPLSVYTKQFPRHFV